MNNEIIDEVQKLIEIDMRFFMLSNMHERRVLYSEIIDLVEQSNRNDVIDEVILALRCTSLSRTDMGINDAAVRAVEKLKK